MDIQPTNQQPISDDQELAKVLAGVNQQAEEAAATPVADEPVAAPTADPEPAVTTTPVAPEPVTLPTPSLAVAPVVPGGGELETIKQDALSELRPLVDKLDVPPEEKFDTYLLLLRSTDDQALIAPAHEAARDIADEARRAQALLDIIKEIDYLSGTHQQAT
jgi:hypothetical protein